MDNERKIKIVAVVSSPSSNGSTAFLVREALQAARQAGAEVEEIDLSRRELSYCRGCFRCMREGRCPIPDDLEVIRDKLYSCDGLILGSPTYGMAPNAMMKNLLDRLGMYTVYTSALSGKYMAGISTAGAVGSKKVAKGLASAGHGFFGRSYVTGCLGGKVGWGHARDDPVLVRKARRLGARMAEDIRKERRYPLQGLGGRVVQALFLRRMIARNILDNRGGSMAAVYADLRARGLLG